MSYWHFDTAQLSQEELIDLSEEIAVLVPLIVSAKNPQHFPDCQVHAGNKQIGTRQPFSKSSQNDGRLLNLFTALFSTSTEDFCFSSDIYFYFQFSSKSESQSKWVLLSREEQFTFPGDNWTDNQYLLVHLETQTIIEKWVFTTFDSETRLEFSNKFHSTFGSSIILFHGNLSDVHFRYSKCFQTHFNDSETLHKYWLVCEKDYESHIIGDMLELEYRFSIPSALTAIILNYFLPFNPFIDAQ